MVDEKKKIKRQIENTDFCIWLFSRYNSKTAREITLAYIQRKRQLEKKYFDIFSKHQRGKNDDSV